MGVPSPCGALIPHDVGAALDLLLLVYVLHMRFMSQNSSDKKPVVALKIEHGLTYEFRAHMALPFSMTLVLHWMLFDSSVRIVRTLSHKTAHQFSLSKTSIDKHMNFVPMWRCHSA